MSVSSEVIAAFLADGIPDPAEFDRRERVWLAAHPGWCPMLWPAYMGPAGILSEMFRTRHETTGQWIAARPIPAFLAALDQACAAGECGVNHGPRPVAQPDRVPVSLHRPGPCRD